MEIFHVGDKVLIKQVLIKADKYGKIINIDTQNNLMVISLIDDDIPFYININSPKINKIDFLPKDHVIIRDLLKDYCNKKGIVDAYDRTINRYRVLIDNEPHWFAPFELVLEDDWSVVSSFSPIKVTLSDEGKKAYEYHFGTKPLVDIEGRTEFTNLAQLMEMFDSTFIYGDKYMLEDDEILVKAVD